MSLRQTEGSGVCHLAKAIEEDLQVRQTGLQKPHIPALADLTACALTTRSVNSGEWIVQLPRNACNREAKERYIMRFLANPLICPVQVMGGFVPELLDRLSQQGETIVLMLDQSKIADGLECLMVSVRVGERALPVAWRVIETQGEIGFSIQKALLESVFSIIPEGFSILLSADRFYGTASLIDWCQQHKWDYRIRLKGNLHLRHEGGELTTGEAVSLGMNALKNAQLGRVITHIGLIQEAGHPEPWIIAMNGEPSKGRTLDYGLRWGIEALFSDLKSRGFKITQTHLKQTDRVERLLLILAVATYWAVSTAMTLPENDNLTSPKNNAA
jgi:hypothetical protein